jgi:hypothetical protein
MLNQVVRYEAVVDILGHEGGRLADIGSGSLGVAPYVGPEWSVTAVDRDFTDYGTAAGASGYGSVEFVEADARDMPFPNGHFTAAVALDIVEHVGPEDRAAILAEMARVASRTLVVGCPTGAAAFESDRRLMDRYRSAGVEVPGWLSEHVENGFPEPDDLRGWLRPHGAVELVRNESLAAHERLARFELTPAGVQRSVRLARPLRRLIRSGGMPRRVCSALVRSLLRGRDRPPSYRTIAVVRLGRSE